MKRIMAVIACLLMTAGLVSAEGNPSDLGLPKSVHEALKNSATCAWISQTEEAISFVRVDGFSAGKTRSGDWIRFIAAGDRLPFKANAITLKANGSVVRTVVDVEVCGSKNAPSAPAGLTLQNEVHVSATPAQEKVVPAQNLSGEIQPIIAYTDEKIGLDSGGDRIRVKGIWDAVDTFNVSHSKFSPFNGEDKERHGKSTSVKARIRPIVIGDVKAGVYATYSTGNSDTYTRSKDRWSYADYDVYGGGLSAAYKHDKYHESSMDLGILFQNTDSSTPVRNLIARQSEKQLEARYSFASNYNRKNGESFIPYWEIGLHGIYAFDVDYSDNKGGNDEYNNSSFKMWSLVDLYDFYLDDAGDWRLTPSLNVELGYLWGKESGYIQGGPGLSLALRKQEMFELKFLNPRYMFNGDGSRIYDYIGIVKPANILRALNAEKTADYSSQGD